jgi:hypothetical protein
LDYGHGYSWNKLMWFQIILEWKKTLISSNHSQLNSYWVHPGCL